MNNKSAIIFQIEDINSLNYYYFSSCFSLDELKSKNNLFRIFNSVDELYKELNMIFNVQKVKIELECDYANLYLSLSTISSQTQEVILQIKKEKKI